MAAGIYQQFGVGGVVFVFVLLILYLMNVDATLSVIISVIAGLVAWFITKGK